MDKSFKELLDRDFHQEHIDEHFLPVLGVLEDIVNYGTNLIVRCFATGDRKLKDAILLGVLLRQAVSMLDAIQILVKEASTYPASLQCRALFEVALYLEWVLSGDAEEKAKYFYVTNVRKKKLWALRTQAGTPEFESLEKTMTPVGGISDTMEKIEDEGKKQLDEIEDFLRKDEFKEVNDEIENLRKKSKRPYDPPWYAKFGVSSVRQMAIRLNKLHEYELIYSGTSEVMHSSKDSSHISFEEDFMRFKPIRSLDGVSELLNFSLSTIINIYILVLKTYRPGELPSFGKKYAEKWRGPFLNIPNITYNYGEPIKL